jgi:hypothetical protein
MVRDDRLDNMLTKHFTGIGYSISFTLPVLMNTLGFSKYQSYLIPVPSVARSIFLVIVPQTETVRLSSPAQNFRGSMRSHHPQLVAQ